jgi:hypothetical protein
MRELRDMDLHPIYNKLYRKVDKDLFSKPLDLMSRMDIASRFTRGNVSMQNSSIVCGDFDERISKEVDELIRKNKKQKNKKLKWWKW